MTACMICLEDVEEDRREDGERSHESPARIEKEPVEGLVANAVRRHGAARLRGAGVAAAAIRRALFHLDQFPASVDRPFDWDQPGPVRCE